MTVADRCGPTPALCHSQDGMRSHCSGVGWSMRFAGATAAGAGRRGPEAVHQVAVAAAGLDDGDLLLQDGGHQRSRSSGRWRAAARPGSAVGPPPPSGGVWRGRRARQRPTSRRRGPAGAGRHSTATAAPGPHACASTATGRCPAAASPAAGWPAPAGVVNAIHSPSGAVRTDGSPWPRRSGADGLQQVERAARVPPQGGVRRGGNAGGDVCDGHSNMFPRPPGPRIRTHPGPGSRDRTALNQPARPGLESGCGVDRPRLAGWPRPC